MSKPEKRVPELRFQGFLDEWEQRKLGEILNEKNDQIPENDEYLLMSFVQGIGVTPKGERYDRSFLVKDDKKKYKKTELGDFIYSSNNLETGSIGFNKTGKAVISPVYSIFSSKTELESQFIGILSTRKDFINKMIHYRQGVVYGQWKIHEKNFLSIKITVPTHDEQKRIIDLFKNLDDTIALHQEKLDKYQQLKKAYVQLLFPQTGENIPSLRFTGFYEGWEQRKLSTISDKTFGGGTPKTSVLEYWKGNFPWIQSSDLKINELNEVKPSKFITQEAISNSAAKIVPENSIAIVTRVGVGKLAFMPYSYATSQDFLSLSLLKVNPYFGLYSLYELLQKELKSLQGTSIKGITKSELLKKSIFVPSNIDEQVRIGTLFKQFDDTLALHHTKLENLKLLKKSFLQKMFT